MSLQTRGKLPAVKFDGAGLLSVGLATSQNAICSSWYCNASMQSLSSIFEQFPLSVCALRIKFSDRLPMNSVHPLKGRVPTLRSTPLSKSAFAVHNPTRIRKCIPGGDPNQRSESNSLLLTFWVTVTVQLKSSSALPPAISPLMKLGPQE